MIFCHVLWNKKSEGLKLYLEKVNIFSFSQWKPWRRIIGSEKISFMWILSPSSTNSSLFLSDVSNLNKSVFENQMLT